MVNLTHDRSNETRIRGGKRLDIQGLRAIAVLSVIANHLWSWPRGGFVGVDVFFVISGFLITGLLVKERLHRGRISFRRFYRRRIRRLGPAATAAILATVSATALIVGTSRADEVGHDGLWAFFFVANWHFAIDGTNYFHNSSVSPLQHYWSLSVEEQFYLVWPALILLVMKLTRGRRYRLEALGATMVALAAASFAYSTWHTIHAPTWAYFSTFDRAWELGAGAALAIFAPRLTMMSARQSVALGWTGFVGIVVSLFVIRDTMHFPAPWSALPVLSTVAVIAAGVAREQHTLVPLVNRGAAFIGDISYSLYLWHYPVVILLLAYFPHHGMVYALTALSLTAVLAVASYDMIERPILRSGWLNDGRAPQYRQPKRLQYQWIGAASAVLLVLTVGAFRYERAAPDSGTSVAALDTSKAGASLADQQYARVAAALTAKSFPQTFTPAMDKLGLDTWFNDIVKGGCADVPATRANRCAFGDRSAPTTIAVLGDSSAMAWMPAVRDAIGSQARIQQLTMEQCPAWDVSVIKGSGDPYPQCDTWRTWALDWIAQHKPKYVLITSAYRIYGHLADGSTGNRATAEITSGFTKTLQEIRASGATPVVLPPPPNTGSLQDCVTRVGSPDDCVGREDSMWQTVKQVEVSVAQANGGIYVPTEGWFCVSGRCPGFVGSTAVTVDGSHLSIQYAKELAPVLAEALVKDGVLSASTTSPTPAS